MSGHPPSSLCTLLHFERTLFPDKFNYDLTPGVIDPKLFGDQHLEKKTDPGCPDLDLQPLVNT